MPTKSGRIKLEDLRQGKTIWKPVIGQHGFVPQAFHVEVGVHMRAVGLRTDAEGVLRTYSLPMYSVAHSGRRRVFSTFHPSRNIAVKELPDGSMMQLDAFATRKACARYIAEQVAGRGQRIDDEAALTVFYHGITELGREEAARAEDDSPLYNNPHHVTAAQIGAYVSSAAVPELANPDVLDGCINEVVSAPGSFYKLKFEEPTEPFPDNNSTS